APFRIPFDTALAIARRLGAGRLVMGQLWSFGDTLRLTAGVYDAARGGAPLREVTTRVAANGTIGAAFNALADSLLGAGPGAARALLLAQEPMFEHRWQDACQRYREILAADSSSFAGWYGLAECNAVDQVVIRYPSDTTRFTFRGSYETAVQAYRRALLLAPAFNLTSERRAIERLPRLLFAERWYTRPGVMDG